MSQSLIVHNWEKTKKGVKQMSDKWILEDGGKRILEAVNGDEELMFDILEALGSGKVEKVLSKVMQMEKVQHID